MQVDKPIGKVFLEQTRKFARRNALGFFAGDTLQYLKFADYYKEVEALCLGLSKSGLAANDRIAILSDTCPRWHLIDLASLFCRGCVVPIYPTYKATEIEYIFNHSESKILVIQNSEQLKKVLEVITHLKKLELIICLENFSTDLLHKIKLHVPIIRYDQILLEGKSEVQLNPKKFILQIESIQLEDEASIIYTSGTTGEPKGAVIEHCAIAQMIRNIQHYFFGVFGPEDRNLVWLPLSHVFGRCDSMMPLIFGSCAVYAESMNLLVENIQKARPTLVCSVPRIFEKIRANVLEKVEHGFGIKQSLFKWATHVSHIYFDKLDKDISPSPIEILQRQLAYKLVFSKIFESFGGKIRFFISGGAPLSIEVIKFMRHCNLCVLEGYGLTETVGPCFVNPASKQALGSVGLPMGDVQIKFTPDGEILLKSKAMFKEYYKRKDETQQVFQDGWFRTGDIGELDFEGFLKITDRKKDLIITSNGKNIAPQKIETLLKNRPHIAHAMIFGERQKYLTALISIEKEAFKKYLKDWGLERGCTVEELSKTPQAIEIIQKEIDCINSQLPPFESIKRFSLTPEEFSVQNGSLTPSLKLKKKLVARKYQKTIDALYRD